MIFVKHIHGSTCPPPKYKYGVFYPNMIRVKSLPQMLSYNDRKFCHIFQTSLVLQQHSLCKTFPHKTYPCFHGCLFMFTALQEYSYSGREAEKKFFSQWSLFFLFHPFFQNFFLELQKVIFPQCGPLPPPPSQW